FLTVNAAPVEGGTSEDFTGVVRALGEALGKRLEGRSVRSARRVMRQRHEVDLAALPDFGAFHDLGRRAGGRRADAAGHAAGGGASPHPEETGAQPSASPPAGARGGGNLLITASMIRVEYLDKNPHLRAAHGGPRLGVHPDDAVAHGLREG